MKNIIPTLLSCAIPLCLLAGGAPSDSITLPIFVQELGVDQQTEMPLAPEPQTLRFAVRDAETKKPIPGAKIIGNAFIPITVTQFGKTETQYMGMFINSVADSDGNISIDASKIAKIVNLEADVTAEGYAKGVVKKRSFDFKLPIIVFLKKEQ